MKDLEKNVVYDLSDLNREERSELFDYLLSVDETYKGSKNQFKISVKDFIRYDFCNNVWNWEDWGSEYESSKIEIKYRPTINAKTLFDPKVNVINPNEKDSILEVILKNKLLALREDLTDLENLLLHNTNLNDFSKTEIMKNIIFINRQSDVLNDVLKDYEIEKLKQQCEN